MANLIKFVFFSIATLLFTIVYLILTIVSEKKKLNLNISLMKARVIVAIILIIFLLLHLYMNIWYGLNKVVIIEAITVIVFIINTVTEVNLFKKAKFKAKSDELSSDTYSWNEDLDEIEEESDTQENSEEK